MSRSDALVLFGATGDLAKKKLFSALYNLENRRALEMPVVGVASSKWSDDDFRQRAREAIADTVPNADNEVVERLTARLTMISGDYNAFDTFQRLASTLNAAGATNPTCYLAIPPSMFPVVAESLAAVGLNKSSRIVVEKPFGRDLDSARELNRLLHQSFDESQIFRIDHYLGKEAVEDLLVFRFANSMLEPIWNRNYVDSVQVTMAESFGVEGRGTFYDSVGTLRDVVQNHLLQVVTFLAMEPPAGPAPDQWRNEGVKVLSAMRALRRSAVIRGQYDGYLAEPGVKPDSTTETFIACRFLIDSWRWAGVPFYVRAGKAMATTALEAVVELKCPPRLLFAEESTVGPHANVIRFRLGSNDGVTFGVQAKKPGQTLDTEAVDLSVDFAAALGARRDAYERLLDDALDGNPRRFAREDMVEEAWRIVQPVLDDPGPVFGYRRGSWGPAESVLLLDDDHWHQPFIPRKSA